MDFTDFDRKLTLNGSQFILLRVLGGCPQMLFVKKMGRLI